MGDVSESVISGGWRADLHQLDTTVKLLTQLGESVNGGVRKYLGGDAGNSFPKRSWIDTVRVSGLGCCTTPP